MVHTLQPKIATAGFFQGYIISPLLFNLYAGHHPPPSLHGKVAQYADDAALLFQSGSPHLINRYLQSDLEVNYEWWKKWRMSVNADKSVAVFFSRYWYKPFALLTFDYRSIPWICKAAYLGLLLNKQMRFSSNLNLTSQKARAFMCRLLLLIEASSDLSLTNLTYAFVLSGVTRLQSQVIESRSITSEMTVYVSSKRPTFISIR